MRLIISLGCSRGRDLLLAIIFRSSSIKIYENIRPYRIGSPLRKKEHIFYIGDFLQFSEKSYKFVTIRPTAQNKLKKFNCVHFLFTLHSEFVWVWYAAASQWHRESGEASSMPTPTPAPHALKVRGGGRSFQNRLWESSNIKTKQPHPLKLRDKSNKKPSRNEGKSQGTQQIQG